MVSHLFVFSTVSFIDHFDIAIGRLSAHHYQADPTLLISVRNIIFFDMAESCNTSNNGSRKTSRIRSASSGADDNDTLADTTVLPRNRSLNLQRPRSRTTGSLGSRMSEHNVSSSTLSLQLSSKRVALTRTLSEPHGHAETRCKLLVEKGEKIAALKPKDWKKVSVKHREKFGRLLEVWENAKSDPELIKIINDKRRMF